MKKIVFFLVPCLLSLVSCIPAIDVFEKDVTIPKQQWESSFKPQIIFSVKDTNSLYNVYVVLRHSDAYNYNNIWIKATVIQPGDKLSKSEQYDLRLASNDKGWLGTAMDDIYEQRVLIQPQTKFTKAGDYQFTLEQVMREDPLQHVLNVGVRVEKAK